MQLLNDQLTIDMEALLSVEAVEEPDRAVVVE
jgi:hypothetical protein